MCFSCFKLSDFRTQDITDQSEKVKALKCTKYEKEKRSDRAFNLKWKSRRPWFSYNGTKGVMTCTTCMCIEFSKQTQSQGRNLKHKPLFITGCTNLRTSTVTDHEHSKGHIDASLHVP